MTELPRIHVVIPAAGIGLRMAANQPKQYLKLLDRPILQWTLERLAELNLASMVVALAPDDEWFDSIPSTASVLKVTGGASRAESVLRALTAIESSATDWVLVHDAVRPLVKLEDIKRLIEVATNNGFGAILAQPVTETLKTVSNLEVVETLDRSRVWRAQTPQMFPMKRPTRRVRWRRQAIESLLLKEMRGILKLQRPVIWPMPNFYCVRSKFSENWPRR